MPAYRAACELIEEDEHDEHAWLKAHANTTEFPAWMQFVRDIHLLPPSSAAAERVFSILRRAFGSFAQKALEDYIECSLMMQYNHRKKGLRN